MCHKGSRQTLITEDYLPTKTKFFLITGFFGAVREQARFVRPENDADRPESA
jgi:hypothetical protein